MYNNLFKIIITHKNRSWKGGGEKMESKTVVVKVELDITEAEKAFDRLLEKAEKLEDTLKQCPQEKLAE